LVEQNRSQVQIDSKLLVPEAFAIYQNYPNPFNLTTTIKYQVPVAAKVSICIYDLQGRLVNNLVDSQHNPGYYSVIWSGKNRKGQTLSSGMYFYQFRAKSENNSYLRTKKMLILK
jgi:flagellar hook assembly protein FlgD